MLKSKLKGRELNEEEKKEYKILENEFNREVEEFVVELKSRFSILADDYRYRDQFQQKLGELYGTWTKNEIQRQLEQVKAWELDFENLFQDGLKGP